jgi:hypothetical protein
MGILGGWVDGGWVDGGWVDGGWWMVVVERIGSGRLTAKKDVIGRFDCCICRFIWIR